MEKKWKDDKCWWEVDEKRKNKKNCWKKILEEEREFWYNDVRNCRREELECRTFYKISHRWHDDDFEQLHEISFWIWKFFKERERDADARERTKKEKNLKKRELRKDEEEENR